MLKFHKALVICTALAMTSPAWAAPDTGNSGKPEVPKGKVKKVKKVSPKTLKCGKGQVVKRVKIKGKFRRICVKLRAGILDDENLYQQGIELAKQGEYDWSLQVLAAIENQDDPRVLNYQGYNHRKSGRLDAGIVFYKKALTINPNYVLAREYLGEGYVAAGKIELAKVELDEIAKRCGVGCEEYQMLLKNIESAVN